ncbi:uncharacterized protein V1516DRAFT_669075 [Lipomyces oligophaga]|uniref:uncharacterized protein n=1 Tax=Lipomyces oligophaga TaxID=45792 RepID=UPI0034CF7DAC
MSRSIPQTKTTRRTSTSTSASVSISSSAAPLRIPKLPADLRRQFYRDLQGLTQYVDNDLRTRISSIHSSAETISTQSKQVRIQTALLTKETTRWNETADKATTILKEAGDIQNWAEILEVELSALEETMRIVYEDTRPDD